MMTKAIGKDTVLDIDFCKIHVTTKEEALERANFKCYACGKTSLKSALVLSFYNENTCCVVCIDCHYEREHKTQIRQYLEFKKQKLKEINKELSAIKNYIISYDSLFHLEEKIEIFPHMSLEERKELGDII